MWPEHLPRFLARTLRSNTSLEINTDLAKPDRKAHVFADHPTKSK